MSDQQRDPEEALALFRYGVIAEAINPRLSPAERGRTARELAARAWVTPEGTERSYSRTTIDRWLAAYAKDGLAGLRRLPRTDRGRPRRQGEWLAEAAKLRRAVPARSSPQIVDIIARAHGVFLSERTVREHLRRAGLSRQALSAAPARAYGRFEAARPNEIWVGDVLHGPFVPWPRVPGSKRAKLFLLVDDYSRLLVHGRWVTEENTRAGQDVLRSAITRRGLPEVLYVDNGAPYSNYQLSRACAVLGIALVHSRPYRPQGRGKQERLNSYIRQSFVAEMEDRGIPNFDELNDLFMAWAEQLANARVHAETKQPPAERFLENFTPTYPPAEKLAEAFRWSVTRRVTKTATVSLLSNRYEVPAELVGRHVELRFDPEELSRVEVYLDGARAGAATPFSIGRHVHPAVPQAAPEPPPDEPGVDYLRLVAAAQAEALGEASISYMSLQLPGMQAPAEEAELMAGVDVWAAHFGFARTPFTKSVPADKLFERAAHAEAVARVNYCINQSALGVVVGDTGAGKTVAVRAAVAGLDRTKFTVVYLANPSGGCRGLYVAIATALGATPRFHKAEAINQAATLLGAEEHERHRRVILLIDEAHLLSPEQLEEVRLLSNAELDSASPFAGILLGQPTLAARLRQGVFAALDQRISVRFSLGGMDLAESVGYLRHHLALAGRTDPLIADDAAARLHRYANGLPRALNNAATAALMAAAADGKGLVDDTCAKKAIAELTRT